PGLAFGAGAPKAAGVVVLEECLRLSPLAIAEKSAAGQASYKFLLTAADEIADRSLRAVVSGILKNPSPTLMARYRTDGDREELRQALMAAGLLNPEVTAEQLLPPLAAPDQAPQPFAAAPGSGYASHHAYPGGLAVHTALNVQSSLGLYKGYYDTYGFKLNRDTVLAAQLLHDLAKPWVFQWREDAASLPEYTVAGTGAHHILGIAESVYRGLPAEVVVAQASAHDNAGTPADEARLVGYIKAAAIIAGQDPVAAGLLAHGGTTVALPRRIEPFVTYLGDHDWIVSVPAAKWVIGLLEGLAVTDYGMKTADFKARRFNSFRNYVFSQATMIGLYQTYAVGGQESLRAAVRNIVAPA
ncbi:MAG TPA: metal-dependent phosphohydrolase, partial [Negativicutes bacterium]|nr:metal-dependent phosphohydrolase [Negativicutes bacterium]